MKSREYTGGRAPIRSAIPSYTRTRGTIPWQRGVAAIGWTPRAAMAVWGAIHAVIFLGLYKLPVRVTSMTYYELGSDTQHVYWPAVQKLLVGHIPYVDPHFFVEYPPLGAGFFLLPALLHPTSLRVYDWLFAAEILAVDLATLPLIARLALRQRVSAPGAITAYGLLVPFLGSVVSQRYDLVPAMLTLGAILALLDRRSVVAWVLLLVATLMKLYPAALVPLFLLYDWRPQLVATRRRPYWRDALRRSRGVVMYAAGLAGSTVAWYLLAPASLERFAQWETRRGIELESVFGSVAELARLGGLAVSRDVAYGSFDVASALTPALKLLSTALTLGLLAAVYLSYARRAPSLPNLSGGKGDSRALVTHATLAMLAVLLGSKLLSIQFLLWLLPLVAVQAYRPRRVAALAFVVVLLSQWVYPTSWISLGRFETAAIFVLALRNLLLVGLFVALWRNRGTASVSSMSSMSRLGR